MKATLTYKVCRVCGMNRPVGDFYFHPSTWDRLHPECKICKRKAVKTRRMADVEKAKQMEREQYRKRQEKKWKQT